MAVAIVFVIFGLLLLGAAAVALLKLTHAFFLSGSRAIARDGLARGSVAPAWSLPDTAGSQVQSPPADTPLQLLLFTNHSLRSFPDLIEALSQLARERRSLETVVLDSGETDLTRKVLTVLGLEWVSVVREAKALYPRYNVRVTPFAIITDSEGTVRASSLVNHAWQLEMLLRLAQVRPEGASERSAPQRRRPAPIGGGV